MKTQQLLGTAILFIISASIPLSANAEAAALKDTTSLVSRDVAEHHLDKKGDRMDRRLETKGDRVNARLDHKGNRIDRRLDRKGDRLNASLDRKDNHRQARGDSRGEAGRHTSRQYQSGHRVRNGANRKVSGKRRR